jgi:hypothetical protein
VVDDLAAVTAFFVELGLKLQGEGPVEGGSVDRVVGLESVRAEIAMMETRTPTLAGSSGRSQVFLLYDVPNERPGRTRLRRESVSRTPGRIGTAYPVQSCTR